MKRRTTFERTRGSYPASGPLVEFLWTVNITLLALLVAGVSWWIAIALWGAS